MMLGIQKLDEHQKKIVDKIMTERLSNTDITSGMIEFYNKIKIDAMKLEKAHGRQIASAVLFSEVNAHVATLYTTLYGEDGKNAIIEVAHLMQLASAELGQWDLERSGR